MTLFRWRDSLSVGVPAIDRDHRRLIDAINHVHYLSVAGDDRAAIQKAVDDVVGHTRDHFRREETLMRLAGYPGLAEHRARHEAFTKRLAAFQTAVHDDPDTFSVHEFYDALADWLLVHVSEEDVRLAPYMKSLPPRWAA